jgi:hypothetical protein
MAAMARTASPRHEPPPSRESLAFYATPAATTALGRHGSLIEALPRDVGGLVSMLQGLLIHEHMAFAYGFEIPPERRGESNIRAVERMLDALLALDSRPLAVERPVDKRVIGVCAHYTALLVALLRAQGVPARARYGFGAYFNPPHFEEHVVCEYWKSSEGRWVLVDTQFDELWRSRLKIEHDVLDLPRDRFLVAGDAWAQCRAGAADPALFGIFVGELRGLWYIAGELFRDVAALNKREMLPWDVWGAQPRPGETLDRRHLAFFDRLAALTRAPDASFAELRRFYEEDERLQVPSRIFNARLDRAESV